MDTTRGNLKAARIYTVDEHTLEDTQELSVPCMFNPYEYSVSKINTFSERPKSDGKHPFGELSKAGAQTLRLSLIFDTYETGADVSQDTRKMWKFMEPTTRKTGKKEKPQPPLVAFEWGVFRFVAFITDMTQQFTLFKQDGTPVRAKVNVTFTQYKDVEDYPAQVPGEHTSIERVRRVAAGDRLDTIAAEVYHDPTKWRRIAEHNHLVNPLDLRPGQSLHIPLD